VEQTERGHRRSEDAALEAFESELAGVGDAMTAMTAGLDGVGDDEVGGVGHGAGHVSD